MLLPEYYDNISNYVKHGGALLEASGPGYEGNFSLFGTALREILPGAADQGTRSRSRSSRSSPIWANGTP